MVAIYLALYSALCHFDNKKPYVRMLFVDYSPAFDTIKQNKLIPKPVDLGLVASICKVVQLCRERQER